MTEKPSVKLNEVIVHRKVPMNAQGCDMLRAIRDFQVEALSKSKGVEYSIPFPSSIHLMMADYCKIKGIKFESSEGSVQ